MIYQLLVLKEPHHPWWWWECESSLFSPASKHTLISQAWTPCFDKWPSSPVFQRYLFMTYIICEPPKPSSNIFQQRFHQTNPHPHHPHPHPPLPKKTEQVAMVMPLRQKSFDLSFPSSYCSKHAGTLRLHFSKESTKCSFPSVICTVPEKMGGLEDYVPFGAFRPIFRGKLLVLGR